MKLQITGRHLEKSTTINTFITDKFRKLDNFFDYPLNCHVILNVEKNIHSCEAKISITGGQLFATNNSEDMYAAIDGLLDKLVNQAKKHKEKHNHHGHIIPKKELANELANETTDQEE